MKHIISLAVLAIAIIHITATLLYLGPKNPYWPKYYPIISKYMDTLFTQRWALFAPEPATSSLKLWYQCRENAPYKDAIYGSIARHQLTRFTFRGKLNFIYQGLIRNLHNEYVHSIKKNECSSKGPQCHKLVIVDLRKKSAFISVNRLVNDLCPNAINPSFKIITYYPKNFSQRNNPENKGEIKFISFSRNIK